jgi:hypothetical protein
MLNDFNADNHIPQEDPRDEPCMTDTDDAYFEAMEAQIDRAREGEDDE